MKLPVPEFPPRGIEARLRLRAKNTHLLQGLVEMDAGVSPTAWQRSTVPPAFQHKIRTLHDGVDTDLIRPDPEAVLEPSLSR